MRFVQLLSRYLNSVGRRRDRRRRHGRSRTMPAAGLVDSSLEDRLMLSATPHSDEPATESAAANTPAESEVEVENTGVGSASGTVTGEFLTAGDTYAVTDLNQNLNFRVTPLASFDGLTYEPQPVVPQRLTPGTLTSLPASDSASAPAVLVTLPTPMSPADAILSNADFSALAAESALAASTITTAALRTHIEATAPTEAARADSVTLTQQPTHELSTKAAADVTLILEEDQSLSHTVNQSDTRTQAASAAPTFTTWTTFVRNGRADETGIVVDLAHRESSSVVLPSVLEHAGISTSSVVRDLTNMLKSFVTFDTVDVPDENESTLKAWLKAQLWNDNQTSDRNTEHQHDREENYADQPSQQEARDDGQRQQKAVLRLESPTDTPALLIAQSTAPPEPPEIAGIWERLRFDSNPRGPPANDRLPASEFTRQTGNVVQLLQLRYSIAPRGPSAASVQ